MRVHWLEVDGAAIRLDGDIVAPDSLGRLRAPVYMSAAESGEHACRLAAQVGGSAWGTPMQRIDGVKLCGATVHDVTRAWGVNTPEEAAAVMRCIKDAGYKPRKTASQTCAQFLPSWTQKPEMPRWRALHRSAIHAGPVVHLRPGEAQCAHIDIRGAFLAATRGGVPRGRWYQCPDQEAVLLDAVVDIPKELPLGPLPVKRGHVTTYPVGVARGLWTRDTLAAAEAWGVEVIHVENAWRPERWESIDATVDALESLPKSAQKALSTRLWGKFAAHGGWTGTPEPPTGADAAVPWRGLWWRSTAPEWHEVKRGPLRPSIAAVITGRNHARVMSAAGRTDLSQLVALHVDSIWTGDVRGAMALTSEFPSLGDWKHEGTGECRYYASGVYWERTCRGDNWGASGMEGVESIAQLDKRVSSGAALPSVDRRNWWSSPSRDPNAVSLPPLAEGPGWLGCPIGGAPQCMPWADVWGNDGRPRRAAVAREIARLDLERAQREARLAKLKEFHSVRRRSSGEYSEGERVIWTLHTRIGSDGLRVIECPCDECSAERLSAAV